MPYSPSAARVRAACEYRCFHHSVCNGPFEVSFISVAKLGRECLWILSGCEKHSKTCNIVRFLDVCWELVKVVDINAYQISFRVDNCIPMSLFFIHFYIDLDVHLNVPPTDSSVHYCRWY